jgi:hypothetical protein
MTPDRYKPQLLVSLRWDHLFLVGHGALFGLIGWYPLGQCWGGLTIFF